MRLSASFLFAFASLALAQPQSLTTTANQTITGVKTFSGSNVLCLKEPSGTDKICFNAPALGSATISLTTPAITGTLAALEKANTWTKTQSVTSSALSDGANIAVDASLSNNFTVTLGGNRTLDNPTNLVGGTTYNFYIEQDGTGSRTLAYGNKYKFAGGVNTLSTAASSKDLISCYYDNTDDNLLCVLAKAFQ